MDTNLKKGKQIRAFCYRMIATGALFSAIITGIMGREALVNLYREGPGAVSGNIYDLAEFREYMGFLYNQAMLGYAGIGDDKGYPLTDTFAGEYAAEALKTFQAASEEMGEDFLYYIEYDNLTYSNVSYPLFSEYDGHLLLPKDVSLCCYWDGFSAMLQFFDRRKQVTESYDISDTYYRAQYRPNNENASQMQLVFAVKNTGSYSSQVLGKMAVKARSFQKVSIAFLVSVALWIVSGMLSLFTGKAARQARKAFAGISVKIWAELKLLLYALLIWVGYYQHLDYLGVSLQRRMLIYDSLWICFPIGCMIYLCYTDLRQNKGKIFAHSLPVKCWHYVGEFIHGVPWYRRAMGFGTIMLAEILLLFAGAGYLFSATGSQYYISIRMRTILQSCILVMLVSGLALLCGFFLQRRFLKDVRALTRKLAEMREGKVSDPLKLSKNSLLNQAAKDLNELENGMENAIEEKTRADKMRVELITNVSHDLKTPLTSIINYADLLCGEELAESAAGYATALREKSYRLKNMVQDVFELSKATSGNLTVEKNLLDLVKLIRQTLADMDGRIQESGLGFKLNISTEPLMIEADGEKLYRVFQNLFVNALQYSLENSRVHIQLTSEEGCAVARVKNTSRMELDFDPEDIIERFVRADSSRTTEGSGLGLSIVQSFTEACGGTFAIETDADMFTACVKFPLSEERLEEEAFWAGNNGGAYDENE